MWCFFREKRASSTAWTSSPFQNRAAAASPMVVRPSTYMCVPSGLVAGQALEPEREGGETEELLSVVALLLHVLVHEPQHLMAVQVLEQGRVGGDEVLLGEGPHLGSKPSPQGHAEAHFSPAENRRRDPVSKR